MAKKAKKRKSAGKNMHPECHITTNTSDNQEAVVADSIESCLADLEEATNPLYFKAKNLDKNCSDANIEGDGMKSRAEKVDGSIFPFSTSVLDSQKERLSTWDAAFESWNRHGSKSYSPGMLPCFETELARHFHVKELSKFLLDSVPGLKINAFERWFMDAKLEENQTGAILGRIKDDGDNHRKKKRKTEVRDPVLPSGLSLSLESSKRLIEEIREMGTEEESASAIVKDLFRRTKAAKQEIASQSFRCFGQVPQQSNRIQIERGSYLVSMLYSRKKWKSPFIVKITLQHYDKLKARFLKLHNKVVQERDLDATVDHRTKALHALHLLIMVITLRYSSLSGGQLLDEFRGGGMQGAIHEQGFDVLKEFFPNNTIFECFASPLNVTLPVFASAFGEIDWHFGSVGSLAECSDFKDGCCCEANPPFTPGFMNFLADWVKARLSHANSNNRSLSFVVVVPAVHAKDLSLGATRVASAVKRFAARAHQHMINSSACTLHIVLSAKEHGYVEGAQHLRPTRYKRSLYDTSVILLQSQKAQDAEPLHKERFESSIRQAFAERHSEEHRKRAKPK